MDWNALRRAAEHRGWRVVTGGKHLKWYAPTGGMVVSSATPSDNRALKNHLKLMRRHGWKG